MRRNGLGLAYAFLRMKQETFHRLQLQDALSTSKETRVDIWSASILPKIYSRPSHGSLSDLSRGPALHHCARETSALIGNNAVAFNAQHSSW